MIYANVTERYSDAQKLSLSMEQRYTCQVTIKKNKNSKNETKTVQPIASKCNSRAISNTKSSKINVFSCLRFLVLFLCFIPTTNADYLCGGRLVDALRYVCGERGIFNPAEHRQRGSHRRHHRPASPQYSITYLCCELGCTIKQLEDYCGAKRHHHISRHRSTQHYNFPTPPSFILSPTSSLIRKIIQESTTTAETTTTTSLSSRRKKPSLQGLRNRYINQGRRDRNNEVENSRDNRLAEIVKVVPEISLRVEGRKKSEIIGHTGTVKALLIQEELTKH